MGGEVNQDKMDSLSWSRVGGGASISAACKALMGK